METLALYVQFYMHTSFHRKIDSNSESDDSGQVSGHEGTAKGAKKSASCN